MTRLQTQILSQKPVFERSRWRDFRTFIFRKIDGSLRCYKPTTFERHTTASSGTKKRGFL